MTLPLLSPCWSEQSDFKIAFIMTAKLLWKWNKSRFAITLKKYLEPATKFHSNNHPILYSNSSRFETSSSQPHNLTLIIAHFSSLYLLVTQEHMHLNFKINYSTRAGIGKHCEVYLVKILCSWAISYFSQLFNSTVVTQTLS